jgi:DNA-binding PadR family transcriptional regulator
VSVRQSVLALLAQGPRYGALLKNEFEQRTGGTWPLNVGQVYTTLARLERDGLVVAAGHADDEGRIAYRLTEAGRAAAGDWWTTPVERTEAARDELVIKLALAVTTPGVDAHAVLRAQRTATMRHLQALTRLKLRTARDPKSDPSAGPADPADPKRIVLEHQLFTVEAELRWLDHVEATLAARSHGRLTAGTTRHTTTTGESS